MRKRRRVGDVNVKTQERFVTRAKAKVNTTTAVILAIVGVVFIALGLFILMRQRHSRSLRKRFGPEYKHAVRNYGDKRKRRQNSLRARSASQTRHSSAHR